MAHDAICSLGRHFVCLAWNDETTCSSGRLIRTEARHHTASAFVIRFREQWLLVTAGHILNDIRLAREQGTRMTMCRLYDGWTDGVRHQDPIPFDFEHARKMSIGNGDDVDYGVIEVVPNTRSLLEANGLVPLVEDDWQGVPSDVQEYQLLGVPSMLTKTDCVPGRHHEVPLPVRLGLARLRVREVADPPSCLVTGATRFYGRVESLIAANGYQHEFAIEHIDGMSGGPIFGLKDVPQGLRYWLIGVQSGWERGSRTIAACYIDPLLRHLDAHW